MSLIPCSCFSLLSSYFQCTAFVGGSKVHIVLADFSAKSLFLGALFSHSVHINKTGVNEKRVHIKFLFTDRFSGELKKTCHIVETYSLAVPFGRRI